MNTEPLPYVNRQLFLQWQRVVLVHDTRSNNSQSNDAQFMHKLYLSLRAINRLTRGHSQHNNEKLKKILLNNSNWA